ncbi:MAG: tetratricopeptide repeat protein [Crocinitomicaceae bacterium]|nr:tetratricopeptide repeat protein [Crocinitomicaceae bacterium]
MSRLYLVLFLIFGLAINVSAQKQLKKIIAFADDQYMKGDFIYALEYYKKALEKDSNSVKLLWKYAETLKAYKDYPNAETYYAKVYAREQTKVYANSLLNLALMQKQNGRYTQALKTLNLSAKKLANKKSSPFYLKTIREIESCTWAKENLLDSSEFVPLYHLPETVNSVDAEFAHTIHDNKLIFSALKADSSNNMEEVYDKAYRTKLYFSKMNKQGTFLPFKLNPDLYHKELNYGNGSYSIDGTRYYFSVCEDDGYGYSCKIVVAERSDSSWSITDTLTSEINSLGSNTTMPFFTRINGEEYLIFSSNRRGGKGGMDLWYAKSIDGINFNTPQNIKSINSKENEVTPYYDTLQNKLFFSSTWFNGFGGYDVYSSAYVGGLFSTPSNLGNPINSPANDLYYFGHNDSIFISSNRKGSLYAKNPTCCSDIYAAYPTIELVTEEQIDTLVLEEKIAALLPVTLYFRNDEPDASTWKTTTKKNYVETYEDYVLNYESYKEEVKKNLPENIGTNYANELSLFFKNQVDFGTIMLDSLKNILLEELKKGSKIDIKVKGYASPIAKTTYNVNLTKRRISSLINYFTKIDNSVFAPYLQIKSPQLTFTYMPFGEYAANQNISDDVVIQNESVYSMAAGKERRIQIEYVSIDRDKSRFPIKAVSEVSNLDNKRSGEIITSSFRVTNTSSTSIRLKAPEEAEGQKYSLTKLELQPNESAEITIAINTLGLKGHQSFSSEIQVSDYAGALILYTNIVLE